MKVKSFLIVISLFIYGEIKLHAQAKENNQSLASAKISNVLQLYLDSLGHYNLLYNGAAYTSSYPGTEGHPFFNEPFFKQGTVKYNHIVYTDVPLLYELASGDILTRNSNKISIILSPEKVQSFAIGDASFLNFPNHEPVGNTPQKFYRVLYDGNVKVLVKIFKQSKRGLHGKDPYKFKQYELYFILKDDTLLAITNKASLINAFDTHKVELNKFLKNNKLRFKTDPAKTLSLAAEWYEQISK